KHQAALIASARALHDVEIVIHKQDFCWAGGVFFVNLHKRSDAVLLIRLRQVPVEIILPKDARITFVREDKRVRQQLVVDDWSVAHNVMVLDERDSLFRATPRQNSAFHESSQTEPIAVAQVA